MSRENQLPGCVAAEWRKTSMKTTRCDAMRCDATRCCPMMIELRTKKMMMMMIMMLMMIRVPQRETWRQWQPNRSRRKQLDETPAWLE